MVESTSRDLVSTSRGFLGHSTQWCQFQSCGFSGDSTQWRTRCCFDCCLFAFSSISTAGAGAFLVVQEGDEDDEEFAEADLLTNGEIDPKGDKFFAVDSKDGPLDGFDDVRLPPDPLHYYTGISGAIESVLCSYAAR